jgi:hypothetical protein
MIKPSLKGIMKERRLGGAFCKCESHPLLLPQKYPEDADLPKMTFSLLYQSALLLWMRSRLFLSSRKTKL